MTVAYIADHVTQAQNRLVAQYSAAPKTQAMIAAMAGRTQAVEDAVLAVSTQRSLFGATALGAQLDTIGEVVGLKRGGLDDATYYVLILGTVAKNNSNGTIETLLTIAKAIFQADAAYVTSPNSPGHARREAFGEVSLAVSNPKTPASLLPLLLNILTASMAGGTALVSISTYDSTAAFACDGPQPWVAAFSDLQGNGGGTLAGLIYANLAV